VFSGKPREIPNAEANLHLDNLGKTDLPGGISIMTWLPSRFHPPRMVRARRPGLLAFDRLESRMLPTTFTVSTTADGGAGSLR
jgi:hypothetical protein